MTESVEARVKKVVAELFGVPVATVTDDLGLVADMHMDSLDAVELAMGMEDEFGREYPDDELERLVTVRDVIEYVAKQEVAA